ncbi:MAG: UpxY family transcription antiterminator [Candidatus Acidiferrales bacterium]
MNGSRLVAEYREPHWYAVQTCANHEKRVRQQLDLRVVETYLPVYESVRQWKDRRVRRELPLFPGYVFVRLALCDRLRVLRTPSVVRIVEFGGQATALPDQEIETLRRGLTRELGVEPYPYLKVGRRVRVRTGPLQGLEGILVRKKNRSRFVISVDLIKRSVAVEIDMAELEPMP